MKKINSKENRNKYLFLAIIFIILEFLLFLLAPRGLVYQIVTISIFLGLALAINKYLANNQPVHDERTLQIERKALSIAFGAVMFILIVLMNLQETGYVSVSPSWLFAALLGFGLITVIITGKYFERVG